MVDEPHIRRLLKLSSKPIIGTMLRMSVSLSVLVKEGTQLSMMHLLQPQVCTYASRVSYSLKSLFHIGMNLRFR